MFTRDFLIILSVVFLVGCTGVASTYIASGVPEASATKGVVVQKTTVSFASMTIQEPDFSIAKSYERGDIYEIYNADIQLRQLLEEYNIPVTMTPRVKYYLNYYTGPGRDIMQTWLDRSGKFMYMAKDIFLQHGVPSDLTVLAFTESGFNPKAISHAGAVGMWQFMPATGKQYGLGIDDWRDDRRDFVKSTTAAAEHLRDLYDRFDDWYLALAAYNAGQNKIFRATQSLNTMDFFIIAERRGTLKLETKDYVPKYLAQLIIYKNYTDYGFSDPSEAPLLFDTVELTVPVNLYVLAQKIECSITDLKELNPGLKMSMTPPVGKYMLRVPIGSKEAAEVAINRASGNELSRYIIHTARSGDSMTAIAKKYNVSIDRLKELNGMHYDYIHASRPIFVPTNQTTFLAIDTKFMKEISYLSPKYYTVKKGENLTVIAKKLKIPMNKITKLNPRINPGKLFPGQVLVIS